MTLSQRLNTHTYELTGFFSSATASTFVFSEFLTKAGEVAVFAFITGMVGAFAAHLYKLIVNKLSKKQ